jgi:hypothetical protein
MLSDNIHNITAASDFVSANANIDPKSMLSNVFGATEEYSSFTGGNIQQAIGAISDFDAVAMAYTSDLDLETKLSKQFAYSTLVGGVAIDAQVDLGGSVDATFKNTLFNNALVKGMLYADTSGSLAFQMTSVGGIVDVNIATNISDFTFGVDNISVDINLENLNLGSALSLAAGLASVFGASDSTVNFLSSAASGIESLSAALSVTSAAADALFDVALCDPEPLEKVVFAAFALLITLFQLFFGGPDADEVRDKLDHINQANEDRARMRLRMLYLSAFSKKLAPYSTASLDFDPVLSIYLDGTDIVVAINFILSTGIENQIVNDLYGILQDTYTIKSDGKAFLTQLNLLNLIKPYLTKQTFFGGYYVR